MRIYILTAMPVEEGESPGRVFQEPEAPGTTDQSSAVLIPIGAADRQQCISDQAGPSKERKLLCRE